MKKQYIIVGLLTLAIFTSCATIFSGTKAKVTVSTSNGEPATARVDGETFYINGPTPIKVKRGFKKSVIEAESANATGSVEVGKKFNAMTIGNILIGGIPGLVIDGATGAMTKPDNSSYVIHMQQRIKEAQPEPKGRVTRDNPGGTELERTIIRWYFDSEPRGARVFWRVVSSVPAEVKNTNESYLGTTPYEDTRSFNINGLTYENSRDVQIEIKIVRPGYVEQMKRFNVRQAIDQQEISSFFDLVEK